MTTQLIDRIRAIVDDGSMSRSGLARAAGLHANSLRDLESPGWNPTAETLRKLETWLAHGSDLSPMASAEEIIAEARNGRMVILVDDEDRENEGDLIIPAQMATPDAINFMATHGRGLICLTLTRDRVDQLGLELMSRHNGPPPDTRVRRRAVRAPGGDRAPVGGGEEHIAEARNGRMVVLVDSEDRENGGDLIIPAQMATPDAINFMATHGRGLICLTLTRDRVDQLGLELMSRNNGTRHGTAFTTSIEAREGVDRSEEHTSELQSLMRISYAVFCLKKKNHLKKQY